MVQRRWCWVTGKGVLLAILLAAPVGLAQTTAPATQATAAAGEEDVSSLTFLQLLMHGGWFMLPIAAASLVGVALILERAVALRRGRIVPRRFPRKLEGFGDQRNDALLFARSSETAAGRVAAAGIERVSRGVEQTERAMEEQGSHEVHRLRKNLKMLYGVSAVAPLLGLLGTVAGMIEAFRAAAVSHGLGRPELLAAGIYEALVCTLAGLMVAIPTLMFYYYCTSKIEQAVADLNDVARQVLRQFFEETGERKTQAEHARLPEPLAR